MSSAGSEAEAAGPGGAPARMTVVQGDRRKAYRPLPAVERRAALETALAAWDRGDWFEAHELLEPAWMGTDNDLERELYQGLIKLAAGYVHLARRNRAGMTKNLEGARTRLARVAARHSILEGVDVASVLDAIDARLGAGGADMALAAPAIRRRNG